MMWQCLKSALWAVLFSAYISTTTAADQVVDKFAQLAEQLSMRDISELRIKGRRYESTVFVRVSPEMLDKVATCRASVKIGPREVREIVNILSSEHPVNTSEDPDLFFQLDFISPENTPVATVFMGRLYNNTSYVEVVIDESNYEISSAFYSWLDARFNLEKCRARG